MNPLLSLYFNFLRVACALAVFIYHAGVVWGGVAGRFSTSLGIDGAVAHLAVVVFFVLSGYLIRHASLRPTVNWRKFTVDRLARLSSVFVPGLALTALTLFMIWLTVPERYTVLVPNGFQVFRFLANLVYMHQAWFWCIVPGFNPPTWSLAYEFWYYVLLGLWCFCPAKWRWPALAAATLLAGPKIILLLPCWLAGVIARDLNRRMGGSRTAAVVCLTSLSVAFWLAADGSDMRLWSPNIGHRPLYYSYNFLFDAVFALVVAFNFWSVSRLGESLGCIPLNKLSRVFEICAGGTFSLYVYHFPLLVVTREWLDMNDTGTAIFGFLICLSIVIAFASVTEFKLTWWRNRLAVYCR